VKAAAARALGDELGLRTMLADVPPSTPRASRSLGARLARAERAVLAIEGATGCGSTSTAPRRSLRSD